MLTFHSADFFPIDGVGFGNENENHNFHFTTEVHTNCGEILDPVVK